MNSSNKRARLRAERRRARGAEVFSAEERAAIERGEAGVYRLDRDEVEHWLAVGDRPDPGPHPDHGRVVMSDPFEISPGCVVMRWWKPAEGDA